MMKLGVMKELTNRVRAMTASKGCWIKSCVDETRRKEVSLHTPGGVPRILLCAGEGSVRLPAVYKFQTFRSWVLRGP